LLFTVGFVILTEASVPDTRQAELKDPTRSSMVSNRFLLPHSPSSVANHGTVETLKLCHLETCVHNGMFPCFFGGFLSRFVSSMASAWISFFRVSRGWVT